MNADKINISVKQFFIILWVIIIVDSKVEGIMMGELHQDYIISSLIGLAGSLGIFALYYLLMKRLNFESPEKGIKKLTGKIVAPIILGLYAVYFIFSATIDLRDITELVRQYYIPLAPLQFLSMPMMIVILYALFQGIEVIARASKYILVATVIAFTIFTVLILVLNQPHFNHLIPIFTVSTKDIVLKGLQTSFSIPYGITIIIIFIMPFVDEKKKILKSGLFSKTLGGILKVANIVVAVLIINPSVLPSTLTPGLIITRRIDAHNFIQRFDLITLAFIILITLIKNSLLIYGAYTCLNGIIKMKNKTLIYVILGVIIITFANSTFAHYNYLLDFYQKYVVTYIHLTFELFLPVVLLLLTFIKKPKAIAPERSN